MNTAIENMNKKHRQEMKAIQEDLNNMSKVCYEKMEKLLFNYLEELFKEVPELEVIGCYGGTPSFNDGDPCVFNLQPFEDYYVNGEEYELLDSYFNLDYSKLNTKLKEKYPEEDVIWMFSEQLGMYEDYFEWKYEEHDMIWIALRDDSEQGYEIRKEDYEYDY